MLEKDHTTACYSGRLPVTRCTCANVNPNAIAITNNEYIVHIIYSKQYNFFLVTPYNYLPYTMIHPREFNTDSSSSRPSTWCIMCTLCRSVLCESYASKVKFSPLIQILFEILASSHNIRCINTKICVILRTPEDNIVLAKRRTNIVFLFTNYLMT